MKKRWLLVLGFGAILGAMMVPSMIAAQQTPPPPYAGLKNPFAWTDAAAQTAGKKVFSQSCQGCHGVKGDSISQANFSSPTFGDGLEARPDMYFWIVSEGRLNQGMPGFKSSLTEEQRWQLLTYVRSLGAAAAPGVTSPTPSTPSGSSPVHGVLTLAASSVGKAGEMMKLEATLEDDAGKPLSGETVDFLLNVDFFSTGQFEIGSADTGADGVATLEYVPRVSGQTTFMARLANLESSAIVDLGEADAPFYVPSAGIKLPSAGPRVFLGPESSQGTGAMGAAPTSALRLPGGLVSWLLLPVAAVLLVWRSYFRAVYQVWRISETAGDPNNEARLLPRIGLAIVVLLGLFLAFKLVIGPYTHVHLPV